MSEKFRVEFMFPTVDYVLIYEQAERACPPSNIGVVCYSWFQILQLIGQNRMLCIRKKETYSICERKRIFPHMLDIPGVLTWGSTYCFVITEFSWKELDLANQPDVQADDLNDLNFMQTA